MKFRREDSNKFDLEFDATNMLTGIDIAKGLDASDFIGAIVKFSTGSGEMTEYFTLITAAEMLGSIITYGVNVAVATKNVSALTITYNPDTGHVSIELTT